MAVSVIAEGLDVMQQFLALAPERTNKAASLALNQIAKGKGMTLLRKKTGEEINFPPGYVDPDKIFVTKSASPTSLEVRIQARTRPTSLAEFAPLSTPIRGKGGLTVQVHRGQTRILKKSFLIRLRSGNVGLAVRVPIGTKLARTDRAVEIRSARTLTTTLYLLYGPSVDQVFREIAEENSPQILQWIGDEFVRQFNRKNL